MSTSRIHEIMDAAEERHPAAVPLEIRSINRRKFMKLTGIAGGGLILGFGTRNGPVSMALAAAGEDFSPNGFVRISPAGEVILYAKNPEIGQGIKTSVPMIVAEELDADWSTVRVEQAPINPAVYGRQSAGGSRSIPTAWDMARRAGAVARSMLVAAAASEWQAPLGECRTESGKVIHVPSGRSIAYGRLAVTAASLPVPDPAAIPLKSRAEYKLLGRRIGGVDNRAIVTGQPLFGIDTVVPDMRYAAYLKCPATGGRVRSANLDEIKALPGVMDAFVLEGNGETSELMPGVAIVANSTWAAFDAKRRLKIEWDESSASSDSWSRAVQQAREMGVSRKGRETLFERGEVEPAYAGARRTVEGFYAYPFLSHAPLEPQNCTAWVRGGKAELWAPTQRPESGTTAVASTLGIPETDVLVHQLRAGGGFGRRLINDFMCEAAAISARAGVPVKLQWTREDDMLHDFYRVGGFHAMKGALDDDGRLIAWDNHFITFSSNGREPVSGGDFRDTEMPLSLVSASRLTQSLLPLKVPTGPWRAPRSNGIAFVVQSFIDELARAAGRDHLEFLLEILGEPRWLVPDDPNSLHTGRAARVIKLAAEKAGWGKTLPAGRGLGLAFHFSHAGHFAEVAEVSVTAERKLTVHKITVAGDVGPIINLSGAENQCQGAVIDGLSTMLGLSLSIEDGRVRETNFNEYPLLRINNSPDVAVHFIESDYTPTGLGEPALPPAAPAICNAIYAASGIRVRELPLSKAGFRV